MSCTGSARKRHWAHCLRLSNPGQAENCYSLRKPIFCTCTCAEQRDFLAEGWVPLLTFYLCAGMYQHQAYKPNSVAAGPFFKSRASLFSQAYGHYVGWRGPVTGRSAEQSG
eukprot:1159753-Pelagomonas_calceolata.AAC.9